MSDMPIPSDEFGLTNCDREPIHALGRVQDYGCLIAMSFDWIISHASQNCSDLIDCDPSAMVGRPVGEFLPEATLHELRTRVQLIGGHSGSARMFSMPIFEDDRTFDVSIHKNATNFIVEFEPRDVAGRHVDDPSIVQALIERVRRHSELDKMLAEAARGLKMISGFDRVMVYRFEEDDSGTVVAEARAPGQEPFLGLRYPASDIPKQARALYLRSHLRIIANVDGPTHEVYPTLNALGEPLDLSLSVTRAVSPIHLEYLRNMGVSASLSVSIVREGRLWGLFACHHRSPRFIDYEKRSTIELFAQLFNYELAQLEMNTELQDIDRARNLHDSLMSRLSDGQSVLDAFGAFTEDIREVIPFDGAAIYSDGVYHATGSAPTEEEFLGLVRFLNTTPAAQVYATNNLGARYPKALDYADRAAGLLALPISRTPRDYLVLFRREIAQSVNWAGNPEKPVEIGPNGIRLTPRKSFEAWQEVVRGQCAPWRRSERRAADALRVTLLEVVLKLSDESNAARKRAQDQQELLIAELNHRVRNILNLIRGLVSQGTDQAADILSYRSVLDARIHALARAHDQLTESEWEWVSLNALIGTELKAFLAGKTSRVVISGEPVELSPTAFTTLALVIHELVTNSAKYGSLSDSSGSVDVKVTLGDDGIAKLHWRERNGPPVQSPTRKGFGTTIIERSIPFELKGQAEVRFRMTGLEADFEIPSAHVRRAKAPSLSPLPKDQPTQAKPIRLTGNALILEDNMIIALDAVDMLTELGAADVFSASSVRDALQFLDDEEISVGLLDVNLGGELSFPVIERCIAEGIPVIMATGYGATDDLVERFPKVPILRKPYDMDSLRSAIASLPLPPV